MDLKGSLVDTKLKVYPSKKLLKFLCNISITKDTPINIIKLAKKDTSTYDIKQKPNDSHDTQFNNNDILNLNKIKRAMSKIHVENKELNESKEDPSGYEELENINDDKKAEKELEQVESTGDDCNSENHKYDDKLFLNTSDIHWIYVYINKKRNSGEKQPYLHELFEGSQIELPKNETIKRNADLEARCVKLRAQQEAREYRKMTKGVDNVRMRFPEDSISYQLKQLNRQLIAIGQFILSIFAGFLFGFRGVEWMVGNLDFGFRLLLGVMCALVIALAEIYFLAKKLNEELNVPETVQLGGPPKFVNEPYFGYKNTNAIDTKEHQD